MFPPAEEELAMIRLRKFCLSVLILLLVLGLTMPVLAADIQGKITSVNPDKNEFVLSAVLFDLRFHLEKDARVFINSEAAKLSDLQAGDEAFVTYEMIGEKLMASEIRCRRQAR
jgi:hypothetical protein